MIVGKTSFKSRNIFKGHVHHELPLTGLVALTTSEEGLDQVLVWNIFILAKFFQHGIELGRCEAGEASSMSVTGQSATGAIAPEGLIVGTIVEANVASSIGWGQTRC